MFPSTTIETFENEKLKMGLWFNPSTIFSFSSPVRKVIKLSLLVSGASEIAGLTETVFWFSCHFWTPFPFCHCLLVMFNYLKVKMYVFIPVKASSPKAAYTFLNPHTNFLLIHTKTHLVRIFTTMKYPDSTLYGFYQEISDNRSMLNGSFIVRFPPHRRFPLVWNHTFRYHFIFGEYRIICNITVCFLYDCYWLYTSFLLSKKQSHLLLQILEKWRPHSGLETRAQIDLPIFCMPSPFVVENWMYKRTIRIVE